MREFNTSETCFPEIHYTVLRKELIKVGKKRVKKGRYFTIFAPRQAGKTTYFELLFKEFSNTNIKPIHIRFASLKNRNTKEFYEALDYKLHIELQNHGININLKINNPVRIEKIFNEIKKLSFSILLVIDEFEGIPECVQNEFMHAIRDMYHQKQNHALHSVILVGVSTVAELSTSNASPFNITDEIKIPYFTREEVDDLIGQYVSETGQKFDENVIRTIYQNTNGQPGLVCGLCRHLVEEIALDKNKSVSMKDFYKTQDFFLTEKFDKNVMNIVNKAKQKKDFMLKLLFTGKETPFTIDDENISFLYAHGVIDKNKNGFVEIPVPFYSKRLMTAFRPIMNGELDHFVNNIHENFDELIVNDEIDIKGIIKKYDAYVRRRGFKAFDRKNLKESACHYSLDAYCYYVIERTGGHIFAEVPSGRGRTDILILFKDKKYIIETKIYTDKSKFEKGKYQLAEYIKTEELSEGFYVVFSNQHTNNDKLYFEEIIEGKKIYTFIICANFKIPSKISIPEKTQVKKLINIYLLYDEPDEEGTYDLADFLFDEGFEVKTPPFDDENPEAVKMHLDLIKTCDGLIIYYDQAGKIWLDKKINELQNEKINRAFVSTIYLTGKKDKRKERFRTRVVDEVIKNFGQFSPKKLNGFVERLR